MGGGHRLFQFGKACFDAAYLSLGLPGTLAAVGHFGFQLELAGVELSRSRQFLLDFSRSRGKFVGGLARPSAFFPQPFQSKPLGLDLPLPSVYRIALIGP